MEDLFKTLGDMFKPPITKGSGMQETEKMNDGGLTDDEGNSINFEVGDTIVEYKRPTPNQSKREYGGNGKIVSIVGAMTMGKVEYDSIH